MWGYVALIGQNSFGQSRPQKIQGGSVEEWEEYDALGAPICLVGAKVEDEVRNRCSAPRLQGHLWEFGKSVSASFFLCGVVIWEIVPDQRFTGK